MSQHTPNNTLFPPLYNNNKVAFQGVLGAYSHLALQTIYPDAIPTPCETFADAFECVENGTTDYAVIPIENSLGGRVSDIHHLLPESELYIVGEYFQPINHCLLGTQEADSTTITDVFSHEQALSQCRHTLKSQNLRSNKYTDTAGAGLYISTLNDPTKGAIASSLCAEIYGLKIIQRNLEDRVGNVTRFIILSKDKKNLNLTTPMTSCLFQTRNVPANLYKALGGFATNGVNLMKLESYLPIVDSTPANGDTCADGEAFFYVEFNGSPNQKNIMYAMEELEFYSKSIRIIGVYNQNRVKRNKTKPDT